METTTGSTDEDKKPDVKTEPKEEETAGTNSTPANTQSKKKGKTNSVHTIVDTFYTTCFCFKVNLSSLKMMFFNVKILLQVWCAEENHIQVIGGL